MRKRLAFYLLIIVLIFSMTACADTNGAIIDILTQKAQSEGKIDITVLVKNAFDTNAFERAVEAKFSNVNIIQVANYTYNMGKEDYYARMKNDDLTDIVMTWPLEVGKEYWSERLIDLSSKSFTGRYPTKELNTISEGMDGKLYYLPGPTQIRGILYNKTLFQEKNWSVPNDFEGFIALCNQIEASGTRSLQLGFSDSEVLDTAFVGYGYNSSYSSSENTQAIADYDNGIGSFGDNYTPALETFQRFIDEGIFKQSDLDVTYSKREEMLFSRECAMIEDSVYMTTLNELHGTTDEFAIMPFFNPGEHGDFARVYPVCYVGANKHLLEKNNATKYDVVMQILNYISTPEGQNALIGDNYGMLSNLIGVEPPNIPAIADLVSTLKAGRYDSFPTLKNAQGALRLGLKNMIKGDYSIQDVILAVDKENKSPPVSSFVMNIGKAASSFTLLETGNFVTDVMREESGCDIALFLDNGKDGRFNGKGISAKFYEGNLTVNDVTRVLPDLKLGEKLEMLKVYMTGENLIKALEYTMPVYNNLGGWFYYFSGLKVEYAPSAASGNRIRNITTQDGKPIYANKIYSVAVMDYSVDPQYILSYENTGIKIAGIIERKIFKDKVINPPKDDRFVICVN